MRCRLGSQVFDAQTVGDPALLGRGTVSGGSTKCHGVQASAIASSRPAGTRTRTPVRSFSLAQFWHAMQLRLKELKLQPNAEAKTLVLQLSGGTPGAQVHVSLSWWSRNTAVGSNSSSSRNAAAAPSTNLLSSKSTESWAQSQLPQKCAGGTKHPSQARSSRAFAAGRAPMPAPAAMASRTQEANSGLIGRERAPAADFDSALADMRGSTIAAGPLRDQQVSSNVRVKVARTAGASLQSMA